MHKEKGSKKERGLWTGRPLQIPAEGRAFSEVGDWIWDEWQGNPEVRLHSSKSLIVEDTTLIWRSVGSEVSVTAVSRSLLDKWVAKALPVEAEEGHRVSLLTSSGQLLAGPQPLSGNAVVTRLASETGLPWTLVLCPGDVSPQEKELADRRQFLSLGLLAIMLLLGGGSYLLWRVIQREIAIARLQAEFVSAVSHEFRTPLASMRHVTELMQEDDNMPLERRNSFYEALARNTNRLQRLVESLLDFARMEGKRESCFA